MLLSKLVAGLGIACFVLAIGLGTGEGQDNRSFLKRQLDKQSRDKYKEESKKEEPAEEEEPAKEPASDIRYITRLALPDGKQLIVATTKPSTETVISGASDGANIVKLSFDGLQEPLPIRVSKGMIELPLAIWKGATCRTSDLETVSPSGFIVSASVADMPKSSE